MKFAINHQTSYQYQGPVRESFNEARLQPIDDRFQKCCSFELTVSEQASTRTYKDFYGNRVYSFEIASTHGALTVCSDAEVEILGTQAPDVERANALDPIPISSLKQAAVVENIYDYVMPSHYTSADGSIWRFAMDCFAETDGYWHFMNEINRRVYEYFEYVPGETEVYTLADEAFAKRKGVCQDYAHVLIAAARSLSIPVRYVSGYLYVPESQRQTAEGLSSMASHAWVEAFIPEVGWIAFDPTHNRLINENYITMARGRDYGDARPISGTYRGAPVEKMEVSVEVSKLT
ncbi:MAG: transglutaminase family protein [Verrucomicrobiota bacterium]